MDSPSSLPTAPASSAGTIAAPTVPVPTPPAPHHRRWGRLFILAGVVVALGAAAVFGAPTVRTALNTISTDDAYTNGHVTFVAPRVSGQVLRVLVDDNYRVKAGDLLFELDPEPYRVQLEIKQAMVDVAEADIRVAESQTRGQFALARSLRWKLQTAIESVDNQVALLHSRAATLNSREATRDRAKADYFRAEELRKTVAISQQEFDQAREQYRVAEAQINEALEQVHQTRVSLGLLPQPAGKASLTSVPVNLNQTFSGVREALAQLTQAMAQIGLPLPNSEATPQQVLDDFRTRDSSGDIDRIIAKLIPESPMVKQAQAKLLQARRELADATLNLRYCRVTAEIDGVVTRRNVNPGNNVQAGQQVMAIRSLTEIWIDCNFKETQLADLRIGQRVEVVSDAYGSHKVFHGRITGFTFGTGSTLALLPAQNATGNFVKVVQRLPVRVELDDYDPNTFTLYAGLSVTPHVYYKEPPTGPNAGQRLQELTRLSGAGAKQ